MESHHQPYHYDESLNALNHNRILYLLRKQLIKFRESILLSQFDVDLFGGLSYTIKTDDHPFKTSKIKLPHTVHQIITLIDETQQKKIDSLAALMEINKQLFLRIDSKKFSRHIEYYKQLLNQINEFSKKILQYFNKSIVEELDHTLYISSMTNHNANENKIIIKELLHIENTINEILTNKKLTLSLANCLPKVIELFPEIVNTITIRNKKHTKYAKYYNKKIKPYSDALQKLRINDNCCDIREDLGVIIKKIIHESHLVKCVINSLDEIEIHIENIAYNLTQLLNHQPDLNSVLINDSDCDKVYEYFAKYAVLFVPDLPTHFPKYKMLNVQDFKIELMQILNNDIFNDCHPACILAIIMYTNPFYIIINKILRDKTLPKDFFSKLPQDNIAAGALRILQNSLRGFPTNSLLDEKEIDLIVKESLMTIIMAAIGLYRAKHFFVNTDLFANHSFKGSVGSWVPEELKNINMAYLGGTPQFNLTFISTSLKPSVAIKFIAADQNNPFILAKVNTFSMDNITIAVDISSISSVPNEAEVLYPPCCLILPAPRSFIKNHHNHQFFNISQKVSLTITSGSGPLSSFYSSEIQKIRHKLIKLLDHPALHQLSQQPIYNEFLHKLKKILTSIINELRTQLKRVDVIIAKNCIFLPQISPKISAAYAFTQDNKLFFISENYPQWKELFVSPNVLIEMLNNLSLKNSLDNLNVDYQLELPSINLTQLNYINKSSENNNLVFKNNHTVKETIIKLNKKLEDIKKMIYDEFSKNPILFLFDFLEDYLKLTSYITIIQCTPSHYGLFNPASNIIEIKDQEERPVLSLSRP